MIKSVFWSILEIDLSIACDIYFYSCKLQKHSGGKVEPFFEFPKKHFFQTPTVQSIWQSFQKKGYFGVNEIINYVVTKFEPHMLYIASGIKVGRLGKSV